MFAEARVDAAFVGGVSDIAAAQHTVEPGFRSARILRCAAGIIAGVIEVGAPFNHVATHVAETKFVGFQLSWFFGVDVGAVRPAHSINVIAAGPGVNFGITASAGGIFPFGFGGESVIDSGDLTQGVDEGHYLCETAEALRKGIFLVDAVQYPVLKTDRELVAADEKIGDRHLVHGFFIVCAGLAAHHEGSAFHEYHAGIGHGEIVGYGIDGE